MSDIFDYGDDTLSVDTGSTNEDSGITALSQLVTRANQIDIEVARAEDQLKALKETQTDLKQRRIPDLMDELGVMEFTTTSGLKVSVKRKVRANITDSTRTAAIAWFKEHNLERMVKNEFKLSLDKGEDVKAEELAKIIEKMGLVCTNKKSVHPSSLSAFVRQRDAAGEDVPSDLFNVYRFSEARIG